MRAKNSVFTLYPFCILVDGYAKSAIYDLEFNKLHTISNAMSTFIRQSQGKSLIYIYSLFDNYQSDLLDSFIFSLIDKQLATFVNEDDLMRFSSLDNQSEETSLINSFVIDIDSDSTYDVKMAIKKISLFPLQVIQIRFLYKIDFNILVKHIKIISETCAESIEIIISYSSVADINYIYRLLDEYQNITCIYLWGSPLDKIINYMQCRIIYRQNLLNANDSCGEVNCSNFIIHKRFYLESLNYNTCLNKKCSIDKYGIIKNCPYMQQGYGYIDNTTTEELHFIIQDQKFIKYSCIKKDDISTCSVCEFRYACFDCRVFIEDKEDLFSKPRKCKYNPYTGKWKNK